MGNMVRQANKRDRRLLLSILLFVVSASAVLVQGYIVALYVNSALTDDWTAYANIFPSAVRPDDPTSVCFAYCFPHMPFMAGWIGVVSFILGTYLLVACWWNPRSP